MPKLSATEPLLHPGATAVNSTFGAWVEIGEGARIVNSTFEDYANCDRFADIAKSSKLSIPCSSVKNAFAAHLGAILRFQTMGTAST